MVKTIILLKAFREEYPQITKEITQWILDNPEESQLKEFLLEVLVETQPK